MPFSVNNYYGGSWVDISDYVVGAGDVPYISRNRDWTARIENWSLEVAGSLRDVRGGTYNFSVGDKFTVKDGTTFLFLGEVISSYFDPDRQTLVVDINNALLSLREYSCTYDTLHAQFDDRTNWYEYLSRDYDDNRILGITWAIQQMFEIAGLTLDAATANASTLFTDSTAGFGAILLREMLIDEDMFYCLNQSVAAIHTDPTVDATKTPTFFEFISEMCSVFGLTFQPSGADGSGNFTYTLVLGYTNYSIGDDDKYGNEVKTKLGEYKVGFTGCNYAYSSTRSDYQTGTHAIVTYTTGGIDNKVNYFTNLYIFYSDVALTTGSWHNITSIVAHGDPEKWTITTATAHGFLNADVIVIEDVVGMTDLNGVKFSVSGVTTYTFNIISSTVQSYISGGRTIELVNNTYRYLTPSYNLQHESDTWNPIYYKMVAGVGNSVTNVYTEQSIICPYQTTFKAIVENFIDLENRTSKIIQETYL